MLISYFSEIEAPRVYGFLLRIYCIPMASAMFKKRILPFPDPDEDCFIEDNTIPPAYRSWRIPGSGNRHYRKVHSNFELDKLPNADALNKFKLEDEMFNRRTSRLAPQYSFRYL